MTGSTTAPQRVYFFSGNDQVAKEASRAAALRVIESAAGALVRETFDPSDGLFADFLDKALTPTLFGDMRLLSINHAESLAERELDELDRLLTALPDDLYVFVDIGEVKRRGTKTDPVKRLHVAQRCKDAPDRFFHRDFQKPPDYKVVQWLIDTAPGICGRPIAKDAAERLVDLAGYDTAVLLSEIGKIDIHLDKGLKIDAAAVELIVGASRPMTVFELAEACSARAGARVLEIIDSLFTSTCSVPMVISVLFRHYSALYRIRHYGRANSADVRMLLKGGSSYQAKNEAAFRIGRAAGLLHEGEERKVYPVIIASNIVARSQQFTDRELETVFSWLLEFDVAVKTGAIAGSRQEMELFCYKLLRVSQLCTDAGYP